VHTNQTSAADLEDFFENGAVALHLVGADGTILRANRAELDLLGYAPGEYIGRNITEFHADRPTINDILARLSRGEKLDRYPARLKAKDGSERFVEITSSVQFKNGRFLNTRCFTFDVTKVRHAEKEVARKERQLQQILDALPAAVYTTDEGGNITYFNPAAETLAGRKPELGKDQWCVTFRLRDPEGNPLPHDQCPMAVALKEQRPVRDVWAYAERPDGSIVPFAPYPTPFFDESGKLTGAVNMLVDITDQKKREQQTEFVMHELSHRSKNLLTIVHSLAARTIKNAQSLREFESKFLPRIHALARTHDILVENQWMGANIRQVVTGEIRAFGDEAFLRRATIRGNDIVVKPSVAQNVNLAVHELLTNAMKYGSLATEAGGIEVEWTHEPLSNVLRFSWKENGGAVGITAPDRKGFGTQLLETIFDHHHVEYAPGGIRFEGAMQLFQ
jgi:PAS domain S-box-containing protein